MEKLNIRWQLRWLAGSVGKRHSCDWILSPADRSEPPGEDSATTAQLENGLSRKKVHEMTESLRTPQHPFFGDWISIFKIPFAVALKTREEFIRTSVGHIFSSGLNTRQSRIPVLNCFSHDRSQRDSNYALCSRIEEVHHFGADQAAGTGYKDPHDPPAFSATDSMDLVVLASQRLGSLNFRMLSLLIVSSRLKNNTSAFALQSFFRLSSVSFSKSQCSAGDGSSRSWTFTTATRS